ncbi:MAG: DUF4279 domain-containing protein [Kofleriaceae bacterium]
MRVRQYAYFAIRSDTLDAAAIGARLGLAADEVVVRGARQAAPPRPATHAWELCCDRAMRIDDQLAELVSRLMPVRAAIIALAAEGHRGGMNVVRYFDSDDGEPEHHDDIDGSRTLPGQHQLLGFHLDRTILAFLVETGAECGFDEYG